MVQKIKEYLLTHITRHANNTFLWLGPMCSILLVEDHADTRRMLRCLLRHWGHDVSTAGTLREGLGLAEEISFDAVLTDIGLPDGNGYDFIEEIAHTPSKNALKVAVTAYSGQRDRSRAKTAGMHHFFGKPVDLDRLQAVLSTAL